MAIHRTLSNAKRFRASPRRQLQEISPVFPRLNAIADHPQPGFVHEGRGLGSVTAGFPQPARGRKISQFIVNQREKLFRSLAFATRDV
jgi:hypothetical protein